MATTSRAGCLRSALGAAAGLIVGVGIASQFPSAPVAPDDPPPERDSVRPEGWPPLSPVWDGPDVDRERVDVQLVPMVANIGQPTDFTFVPGHPDRLIAASKWGSLSLVDLAAGLREHWVWTEVTDALECGVLGVALHPQFADNGRFWVSLTPRPARDDAFYSAVREFRVDPASLRQPRAVADILTVRQPAGTHNGGQLAFGPDGMLYVAFGDGSVGSDPHRSGQNRRSLLGALLRLDVTPPGTYRVPPDNPFVGDLEALPHIWAYGLRNPWRFAFAPDGQLVVADVGQNRWEEVNVVGAGDNLGWPVREGRECYEPPEGCVHDGMVDPVYTYGRLEGVSITGGMVWTAPGPLNGKYIFGDFGTGRLWAMTLAGSNEPVDDVVALGRFDISPSAFARDPEGQVWVADFRAEALYRIDWMGGL